MSCGATENIATTMKISHRPRSSNPSYVTVYGTCITQPNSAVVVPSWSDGLATLTSPKRG